MSRALVSVSPSDPADVLGTWPSADAGAVDAAVSRAWLRQGALSASVFCIAQVVRPADCQTWARSATHQVTHGRARGIHTAALMIAARWGDTYADGLIFAS